MGVGGIKEQPDKRDPCDDGNVLYLDLSNFSFARCYHCGKLGKGYI